MTVIYSLRGEEPAIARYSINQEVGLLNLPTNKFTRNQEIEDSFGPQQWDYYVSNQLWNDGFIVNRILVWGNNYISYEFLETGSNWWSEDIVKDIKFFRPSQHSYLYAI